MIRYLPVGNDGAYHQASNGSHVFSASRTTIDAVDLATGAVSILDTTNLNTELRASRDGRFLYYCAYDNPFLKNTELRVYDLAQGQVIQTLPLGSEMHLGVALSRDGSRLGVSSTGGAWLTFSIDPTDGSLAWIPVPNQAPQVFPWRKSLYPLSGGTITASVVDDGRPEPVQLSFLWSKVSGPGGVVFETPQETSSPLSFSSPGIYTLRFTASDGERASSAEVRVIAE